MKRIGLVIFVMIAVSILVKCTFHNGNENIVGVWEGILKYPGFESRIVFKITLMPERTLKASMLRPDENDNELPVSTVVFEDSNLRLEVDMVNVSFEGQFRMEKEIIEGQWKQGKWSQPLVLKRVLEVVKPARPQTPVPPYPYNEKNVTFTNKGENIELAGTLTWPREGSPCPAVVLISGAGAHDRDYSILRHRPFLVLSDYFTRRGFAVLRFDDRGVGDSTGDRSQATSEDYAQDVLAGINFLKACIEIDPDRIGLIGHSEGGTIAALAAAQSPDIAFIVMMGSPGLSGEEYNYQYEESMGRALGLSEEAIAAKRTFQEHVFKIVLHEKNHDVAKDKLFKIYEELNPNISEAQKQAAAKRFLSPWFYFNLTHDPGDTLMTINCPVLAIIGEKDVHVPPEGNIEAIKHALKTGGSKDYRVEKLSGLNHFFQTAETGAPFEYGKIEETISPIALELIGNWVLEHTKKN